MNNYQLKYIALKKDYEQSDGAAEYVQSLYEYKDFLEGQNTPETKWVLVDVCETLELYQTAYKTCVHWLRAKIKKSGKAAKSSGAGR